jgi:hypothetical protein
VFGNPAETVAVCGAGAAGLAAAVAAARAGAHVNLIESRPALGGTVTHALIHTLGGLFDAAGEFLNGGLARELADALAAADPAVRRRRLGRVWVLNACPDVYQSVVCRLIAAEPRITLRTATRVTGVVRSTDRVLALDTAGPAGTTRLPIRGVVDATGTAEVILRVDMSLVNEERRPAAGGLIVRLRGVAAGALSFPRGLAVARALRRATDDGTLPPDCRRVWIDTGVYNDEAYVKLFVPRPDEWHGRNGCGELTKTAVAARDAVVGFLRRLPEFARAEVARTGCVGVRDGGRAVGEYLLTADDVRQARKFPATTCRCAWPIEYWDPDRGVTLEYVPDGDYYEIPMSALKLKGFQNVWVAGKCLSADPLAQASARVVGTCWAMGEAAGRAAAA